MPRSASKWWTIWSAHFGVDFGFLRHNDHTIHATVLVALWPIRVFVPEPDPIGVVYFAGADSIFVLAENLKEPFILRPGPANADYQRNIEAGTGIPNSTIACVPLLSGDVTAGTLGFVKVGDREWLPDEINALKAISSLFAQVQARVIAEDRVLYLAEHDDLTDLLNRRALIAHLDERLLARRVGSGLGVAPRSGPAQGDQRPPRSPHRRPIHQSFCRAAARSC